MPVLLAAKQIPTVEMGDNVPGRASSRWEQESRIELLAPHVYSSDQQVATSSWLAIMAGSPHCMRRQPLHACLDALESARGA